MLWGWNIKQSGSTVAWGRNLGMLLQPLIGGSKGFVKNKNTIEILMIIYGHNFVIVELVAKRWLLVFLMFLYFPLLLDWNSKTLALSWTNKSIVQRLPFLRSCNYTCKLACYRVKIVLRKFWNDVHISSNNTTIVLQYLANFHEVLRLFSLYFDYNTGTIRNKISYTNVQELTRYFCQPVATLILTLFYSYSLH